MAEKESIFRKALNIIPPNVRQFTYDVFGGKEDFTEEKLSPAYEKELKGIAEKALSEGRNTISYEDYEQDTINKPLILNLLLSLSKIIFTNFSLSFCKVFEL